MGRRKPPVQVAGAARCGAYETRPEFCRVFPRATDYRPLSCTYAFDAAGQRSGECDSTVCGANACCNFPRLGGAPEGGVDGKRGRPCEHLVGLVAVADSRLAMTTAYELRSGDVYVVRLEDTFGIGQLDGHRATNMVYIAVGAFLAHLDKHGPKETVAFRCTAKGGPDIVLRLTPADVAAVRRLYPRPEGVVPVSSARTSG